jgi:hypothetical protein
MNTASSTMIIKRDGTREPFSPAKLRRIIIAGMRACRYDVKLAEPLVQAVEVHLRYWEEPKPPTSEYVFRCVFAVLKQTGLKDVAECLAAHRRWRRMQRRNVRLLRQPPKRGSKPWRKASLVAHLRKRFGVGQEVARIVAGDLEMRVLNLGFQELSQRLMEELVLSELAAWGLLNDDAKDCAAEQAARRKAS